MAVVEETVRGKVISCHQLFKGWNSSINWINYQPLDISIAFGCPFPMESDLCAKWHDPTTRV